MQPSPTHLVPEAGLSALCRAIAPGEVRISYCASQALPFRIELPSSHGLLIFRGETAEAAAQAALRQGGEKGRRLVALAIEPSGDGPYVEAVREWIEQASPPTRERPTLRLVR